MKKSREEYMEFLYEKTPEMVCNELINIKQAVHRIGYYLSLVKELEPDQFEDLVDRSYAFDEVSGGLLRIYLQFYSNCDNVGDVSWNFPVPHLPSPELPPHRRGLG
jgi:hypothetical protein